MIKQPAEQLLTASYIHVTMTCCSQAWPQAILNHDHKHINVKRVCSQGFIIRSWLHTLPFSVYFLYAFGIPSTYLPSRYFRYAFNIFAFQILSVYLQFALSMPSVCFRYSGAQEYIRISARTCLFSLPLLRCFTRLLTRICREQK